jgi:hypothetical protein
MACTMCHLYFITCFLFLFGLVQALELKSVRPHEWKGQNRRALIEARDTSALDLQSYETFLWEAPGQ